MCDYIKFTVLCFNTNNDNYILGETLKVSVLVELRTQYSWCRMYMTCSQNKGYIRSKSWIILAEYFNQHQCLHYSEIQPLMVVYSSTFIINSGHVVLEPMTIEQLIIYFIIIKIEELYLIAILYLNHSEYSWISTKISKCG